jgi:hypothetical protein
LLLGDKLLDNKLNRLPARQPRFSPHDTANQQWQVPDPPARGIILANPLQSPLMLNRPRWETFVDTKPGLEICCE